ncbi:MAG: hypothetical protein U0166_28095 [Acidobacteriota bacterium]
MSRSIPSQCPRALVLLTLAGLAFPVRADAPSRAEQTFAKMVQGLGGQAKVDAVKDLTILSHEDILEPKSYTVTVRQYVTAARSREEMELDGSMYVAVIADEGFTISDAGVEPLPAEDREKGIRALKRQPLFVAQQHGKPTLVLQDGGTAKIGTTDADVLDVTNDGVPVRFYVEPATGRILRKEFQEGTGARTTVTFADFRLVDGIGVAFRQDVKRGDLDVEVIVVEDYKINSGVDPKLFSAPDKPATPAPK